MGGSARPHRVEDLPPRAMQGERTRHSWQLYCLTTSGLTGCWIPTGKHPTLRAASHICFSFVKQRMQQKSKSEEVTAEEPDSGATEGLEWNSYRESTKSEFTVASLCAGVLRSTLVCVANHLNYRHLSGLSGF